MTKVVQIYSYKGGAGRTVGAANIAAILAAEFKKKVVCIDLDIESAGMSMVLGLYEKLKDAKEQLFIQNVFLSHGFKSEKDFRQKWSHLSINIGEFWKDDKIADRFDFVPARAAYQMTDSDLIMAEDEAHSLLSLLSKIKLFLKPDFILIDSASGLTDPATIGMAFANILCIFFRWNNQFVTGTIDVVNETVIKNLESEDSPLKQVLLVPSAVPDANTEYYSNLLSASRNRIKATLSLHSKDNIVLTDGIPESVGLKWEEKVLVRSTKLLPDESATFEGYKNIAQRLVNIC